MQWVYFAISIFYNISPLCYHEGMKTIRELSEQLKVTPQSVRNELQRQGIATLQNGSGRGFVVSDEDAERIKKAFAERQESKAQGKRQSKNAYFDAKQKELLLLLQRELDEKTAHIQQQDERIERQEERIDRLTATVQEQTENMKALTAALENTTQALHAAQALHAGTIQERLETKEDETIIEPQQETTQDETAAERRNDLNEPPKKSFWQRIFGKR